jgi:hypothetical protein
VRKRKLKFRPEVGNEAGKGAKLVGAKAKRRKTLQSSPMGFAKGIVLHGCGFYTIECRAQPHRGLLA